MEHDHPDIYPTSEEFRDAFQDFVGCLTPDGLLLLCGEDPGALGLQSRAQARGLRTFTYGINNPDADYQAKNLEAVPECGYSFEFSTPNGFSSTVNLQVPGEYNVLNALGSIAVADQLNLPLEEAAQALSQFCGTGRRFDVLGEVSGILVIDDYAHHPTEIRATITAARERYPNRELWVVWQPHTYSRTKMLFDEFAAAFKDAHRVVVSEVYRSREPIDPDFSAQQVVKAMRHKDVHFIPDLQDVTSFLLARLKPNEALLVLSAGDADQVSAKVFASLHQNS